MFVMTARFIAISIVLILVLLIVSAPLLDAVLTKYRRKKYPEYFKLLDAGNRLRDDSAWYTRKEAAYLEFQFKFLTKGLRDGECTEEYFKQHFNELADHHADVTKAFIAIQAEAENLLREADVYAKENNLLWGILY